MNTQKSEKYSKVKEYLASKGVSCCGYTDQGNQICVYNSLEQLTIDCDKPIELQLKSFLNKWLTL